ncbi:MAG: hypothetical protein IKY19_06470 [Bacteroidaceae bacterium]|nr:hypothetical protein [Bacteroidaceae bacterium]
MADEETMGAEQQPFGAQDYLDNLSALKENMVSKEEYQKILDDNRKMANALANGINYSGEEQKEPVDIDELRDKLFSPEHQRKTNLQYFTEVLQLRDALIEAGQPDPFLPFNREYIPTQQDMADAERIANNLKECVETAAGDPAVFNVELQRRCGYKKRG